MLACFITPRFGNKGYPSPLLQLTHVVSHDCKTRTIYHHHIAVVINVDYEDDLLIARVDRISSALGQIFESLKFLTRSKIMMMMASQINCNDD